ncbi:MAG: hypothetical protein JSS81_26995 [Acidobacteria bacterium]|nr:hypothetical protein [Acidobacteriota bacterium]
MKPALIFIAVTFLLIFTVGVPAQKIKAVKLGTADKIEIIKQVLSDGIGKLIENKNFDQCLTPLVKDKKVLFLMTDIDKSLIPRSLKDYRLLVMSYRQISREVLKNNGECYFKLGGFQVAGAKVSIWLDRIIDEIYRFENTSKYTRWIAGEGFIYEFKKIGRWKMISSDRIIISS